MRSLEEKLSAVEELFNRGSKSYQVAVEIVRKGRDVTMDERALLVEKIGCSSKTVGYVLTRLRKTGLYGSYEKILISEKPQKTQETQEDEKEKEGPPEPPKEEPKEEPEPKVEVEEVNESEEEYVTVEDFNRFVGELRAFMGITPIQEPEMDNPGYMEEQFEAPTPESVALEGASMKQMGTWIEAKILLLFDFAKNGAFGGVLEGFGINEKGERINSPGLWSDFVNIVIDDYFMRACTMKGFCKYRMNLGLGLLNKRFA